MTLNMTIVAHRAEDLPISLERQEELQRNWRDLPRRNGSSTEILVDRCNTILSELPEDATKKLQIITLY